MRYSHVNLLLTVLIIGIVNICGVFVPHQPSRSIRDDIIRILAANGCTNRLVALQVIDAYQNGLSSSYLVNLRLDELTGVYPSATILKWYVLVH